MNKNSNQKRSRNRGGSGRRGQSRSNVFDSNGPDVKVRGTAQQVLDKYLQFARDAQSSGDRIRAEGLLQFAEHYFRVINANAESQNAAPAVSPTPAAQGTPAEEAVVDVAQPAQPDAGQNVAQEKGGEQSADKKNRPRQRRNKPANKPDANGNKAEAASA